MNTDNAIREAVRDRATGEPFADYGALADRAVQGAHRRTQRRVAIAVATVAALIAGGAGLAWPGERPDTAKPAARPTFGVVPGWASVPAYAQKDDWFVANPLTGRYQKVPAKVISVSPNGRHAALWLPGEPQVGIWDVVRRSYLNITLTAVSPLAVAWSPDSRWFAARYREGQPAEALLFVDVRTGASVTRPAKGMGFTFAGLRAWSTDGEAVLIGAVPPQKPLAYARIGRDGSHALITMEFPPLLPLPHVSYWVGSTSQLGRPADAVGMKAGKQVRMGTIDLQTGQVGPLYPIATPEKPCDFIAADWCARIDGKRPVVVVNLRTGRSASVPGLPVQITEVRFGPKIAGSKTLSVRLR